MDSMQVRMSLRILRCNMKCAHALGPPLPVLHQIRARMLHRSMQGMRAQGGDTALRLAIAFQATVCAHLTLAPPSLAPCSLLVCCSEIVPRTAPKSAAL